MLNVRTAVGCGAQKQRSDALKTTEHEKGEGGGEEEKKNLVNHHLLNRLLHILNFLPFKTVNQHNLQQQQQQQRKHDTVSTK